MDLPLIGNFSVEIPFRLYDILLYDSDLGYYNAITNIKAAMAKRHICNMWHLMTSHTNVTKLVPFLLLGHPVLKIRLGIVVECIWKLMAHSDARERKWRGKWRMEWVASTLTLHRNVVYPALLMLMRTTRLPVVDWTDAPAVSDGLVG